MRDEAFGAKEAWIPTCFHYFLAKTLSSLFFWASFLNCGNEHNAQLHSTSTYVYSAYCLNVGDAVETKWSSCSQGATILDNVTEYNEWTNTRYNANAMNDMKQNEIEKGDKEGWGWVHIREEDLFSHTSAEAGIKWRVKAVQRAFQRLAIIKKSINKGPNTVNA